MKPVLVPLAALLIAVGPAAAQAPAPAPPPPSPGTPSNYLAPGGPFSSMAVAPRAVGRCFEGGQIVAANRAGRYTLYLQTQRGPIWRVGLAEPCEALAAAEKLAVRTESGRELVCEKTRAKLIVQTATGAQACKLAGKPAPITRQELAAIAPRR